MCVSVTRANGFEMRKLGKHGTGSHQTIVEGSKTSVLLQKERQTNKKLKKSEKPLKKLVEC